MNIVTEEELRAIKEAGNPDGKINVIFKVLTDTQSINPCESSPDRMGSITFGKNKLYGYMYKQRAEVDTEQEPFTDNSDLVFSCIGYKSIPIGGEPFDNSTNIIPNVNGCILTEPFSTYYKVGKYSVGWIKTGATGVIDTTLKGTEETFNNMVLHMKHDKLALKEDPLIAVQRKIQELSHDHTDLITSFDDWMRIDAEERRLGELEGRCRVKMNSYDQIREFLHY